MLSNRWKSCAVVSSMAGFLFCSIANALVAVKEQQVADQHLPAVCLFGARNYEDHEGVACYVLESGEQQASLNIPLNLKNKISSMRFYNQAAVRVYEHAGNSERMTKIFVNTYEMDLLEDAISAISLYRRSDKPFACLFEHPGFRGTPHCFQEDNRELEGFRKQASSVLLGPETLLRVYNRPGFHGTQHDITSSYGYLNDIHWDDGIESLQLKKRAPFPWEQAIDLMYQTGNEASFYHQHRLGSHNSYQSDDYIGKVASLGPNQKLTIYQQLEIGARVLELDVHGSGGVAYLCHQTDCFITPWYRINLRRILAEIKSFLDSRPNQFVLVRLEDSMNKGEYDWFYSSVVNTFGNQLFTPAQQKTGFKICRNGGTRPAETLVTADLLKQGKQIMIMGLGCGRDGATRAEDIAFIYPKREVWIDHDILEQCDSILSDNQHYVRAVESDNIFCSKRFDPKYISTAARCGLNDLGLDHISIDDSSSLSGRSPDDWAGRNGLQFWTFKPHGIRWLEEQPACVVSIPEGYEGTGLNSLASYETDSCDSFYGYLCRKDKGLYLAKACGKVIQGKWQDGEDLCRQDGGGMFSYPRSPVEAFQMMQLLQKEQVVGAWLNLRQKPDYFVFQ